MKKSLICLALISMLLGCGNQKPIETKYEKSFSPLCGETHKCGTDWDMLFAKESFPSKMQILFNDVLIIDECEPLNPRSTWHVTETGVNREFSLLDYIDLEGTETLSMKIFDMKDCLRTKSEHSNNFTQNYVIKNVGGKKFVYIERK